MTISNSSKTNNPILEILEWSKDRPEWQRDALRRILSGSITQSDIDELELICLAKHKALQSAQTITVPIPAYFEEKHVPGQLENASNIHLVSLGQLTNVNRLPSDQVLKFGSSPGLTIIYGDNGAGKSGYARVIKKACNARIQAEQIEPNVYSQDPPMKASATFVIHANGVVQPPISWQDGADVNFQLRQVFLFDSDCADHYISVDSSTTFTPFGLDILEKLSTQVCTPLGERIKTRRDNILARVNTTKKSWRYKPSTVVGGLLANFNDKTKKDDFFNISEWSESDSTRLADIRVSLASNPRVKSEQSKAAAQRVNSFRRSIVKAKRTLCNLSIRNLQSGEKNALSARKTAEDLAAGMFNDSYLPGTGENIWQNLWNAARQYSFSAAYSNKAFPVLDDNAQCVLCQSTLDDNAKIRLKHFDDYMTNAASKIAEQTEEAFRKLRDKIVSLENIEDKYNELAGDLTNLSDDEHADIKKFINSVNVRLQSIKNALNDHNWSAIPSLHVFSRKVLKHLEKKLLMQAQAEIAVDDPEERLKLEKERDELEDRQWFSGSREEILSLIDCFSIIENLNNCLKETITTLITTKNKDLTHKFVTDEFCKRFELEIEKLGLKSIKVKLCAIEGKKGATSFGVRLQNSDKKSITRIASEGEKRCISLALFLAELSQSSDSSTLVFDDPVSSVDHLHKEKIAQRLVEESLTRQVIVFTHDTILLHELRASCDDQMIEPWTLSLEWRNGIPGYYLEGLPWDWKSPKERLDMLEKKQREIQKNWNPIPNEANKKEIREAYSWLRSTLERIIEANILCDLILRFRQEIKVGRLKSIIGFSQEEYDLLNQLHKKCCETTEAHDPAQAKHFPVPSPEELNQAILKTKELMQKISARNKKTN